MDNNSVYILTDIADSLVDVDTKTMNDWLISLDEIELSKYYRMCSKPPGERSGQEGYEICRHSIVLYCRELELTELGLNSEFIAKITGAFCINVIIEALRRQGVLEVSEPLLIYKVNEIKLAENYRNDK